MKVRLKDKPETTGHSGTFNINALSEAIIQFDGDKGADSEYLSNIEVWLVNKQEWKSLNQAFKDHDVIINNHNTRFFEPINKADGDRGYTLT